MPSVPSGLYTLPALTAGILNQGLNNYVPVHGATIFKNVISVSANGANTGAMFYQTQPFTVLQDAYVIDLIDKTTNIDIAYIYLVGALQKSIRFNFDWTNKAGWERIKNEKVTLPVNTDGTIAFDYMETYIKELEAERIKELEAYLVATGLNDYVLSDDEKQVIADFRNGGVAWYSFNVKDLFGKSVRGKRLKSSDRIIGKLPFVTAGETDQGISAFIGNNVQIFKRNTTTIDMFGSAKYRNYEYGGDDHIAVVNTELLPKYASLFVTTTLNKSAHTGKFDYSRNFYAKDADELQIMLPITTNQKPDYDLMSCYIRAIEKMVIKGVVEWKDRQIETTKNIVQTEE